MMQVNSDNPEINESQSKAQAVDLFTGGKITEGVTSTIDNFTENLSQGLVNVDSAMQSFVNQMGQGQGLASEIRAEFAGAAEEVIALGGTQKEAAEIQEKTLTVLGRNVILSKEQTKELFAAQKISGVEIDVLEQSFINAGKSIKDISKEMLQVREISNNMGVNAKAVSALVVENLGKLNRYGFQNGVEGLAKMAASSQALGIDMTETLDLADDLMSPERSMEVAAMFQRMGASSAALTNPLKLMDLSMNDTAKLQEELGDYFKSFAKFNEKTGQFEIAKSERLKIKQLTQELGISREQIEKMALAGADLDKKLSKISFAGFNVDEETKQMVANMSVMGEGGEYVIQTKEVDKDGKPTGELIQQSIQDFLTSTKGDKDAIKEVLGAQQEAATKRPIEDIAADQLNTLDKINVSIKSLVEQPGLTLGASPAGEGILKANLIAAQTINQEFQKRLDTDSKISQSLDNFGLKLGEGLTAIDEGEGYQKLFDAFKVQGDELAKTTTKELTAGGIEIVSKFGDLTGLKSVFDELELTDDVKEILEEIKKEGTNLSEETIKMIDETLKKINEKDKGSDLPGAGKKDSDLPGAGKKDSDLPGAGKKDSDLPGAGEKDKKDVKFPKADEKDKEIKIKEVDEEQAKETIDKITKKTGEIYDSVKETIFEIFKEITTERIDVNELNVIGETKNNLKTTSVTESQTTLEPSITEINPQEAIVEIQPTETINPQKASKEEESIKSIGREEIKPKENVIGTELGVKPEGLQQVKLVEILPVDKIETNDIITDRIIIQGGVDLTNLVTTKTEEPKTISTPPVTTPTPLINTKTIDEIVLSNTNSSEILKSFEKSSKEIGELKIGEEPKKVELAGPKQEKGFTGFEPKILSTISEKDKTILSKLSQEIVEKPETTIESKTNFISEQGVIESIERNTNFVQQNLIETISGFAKETLSTDNVKTAVDTTLKETVEKTAGDIERAIVEKEKTFLLTSTNLSDKENLKSIVENTVTTEKISTDKSEQGLINPVKLIETVKSEISEIQESESQTTIEGINTSNQTLSTNFKSEIEKIKDLKITSNTKEITNLGNYIKDISSEVKSSQEKTQESQSIFLDSANNVFENQSESTKSFIENNTKELPTTPKTNEGEDLMSKYSVIDKDGNKTISPMGRRVMKQLSEKEKEYEGEKGGFLDKILPKEQTIEAVKDLKITSDSTETIKLGNDIEKLSTEIITSADKTSDISKSQSESIKSFVENNTKELQSSNQTLSSNFKSELEKIKDLKITTDNTETIKLGGNIEKLSSEIITSNDKTTTSIESQSESTKSLIESSQNTFEKSSNSLINNTNQSLESQSESTKSFIENNSKDQKTFSSTLSDTFKNDFEKIKDLKITTDNKETIKLGGNIEKLTSEVQKSSNDKTTTSIESQSESTKSLIESSQNTFSSTLSDTFKNDFEKIKDLKITTDNKETIKLGKNVENIFTKFENQSDSVKSILEKNSKSTDIFTELSNTNKTILEKTKDEGTNVKTSILNETTDTFINKINEGVEIANKTEEKKNQLSEIQNTITDKDFEKRVAISESLIRDLDITKEQLKISTENALLVEKEKENIETVSNFKESDFNKRVEESESLISALDKEIEKQKNVESTVDSTKTLTEQMSNLYKEENFLTVTKPIDAVENETETNVINASPIQPTIAPIELDNKNVKPEELSTKVQDFLANQPKQVVETGTNEPIKIETKLTIDGDPRFASLLDARKLQETIEGVMTKSINKPQFAQKISTGTQRANMGMT